MLFWVEFHPCRPDFHVTMTPEENALMVGHLTLFARYQEEGRLKFAGRSADASHGLAIFDVESEAALREMLVVNPAVAGGALRFVIKPYTLPID